MQNKAIIGTATATKVFAETAKKNTQIIDIMDANKRASRCFPAKQRYG